MINANKIIVALDTQDPAVLAKLFTSISGYPVWLKVGMEIFYSIGPKVIHEAKDKGFNIFLDLKLHDIPNTVHQGLKSLLNQPIDMINVHAMGGLEMMMRAKDAIDTKVGDKPLLIAVTQLTSSSEVQMNNEQGISGKLEENVIRLAKLAKEAGLDGVVSSPYEVVAIKKECGPGFLTITPGIRPSDVKSNDQKRIATPQEAITLGSDYLVIGRPITDAIDPRAALDKILKGK